MDPGLIHSYKSLKKTVGICLNDYKILVDMLSQVYLKSDPWMFGIPRADTLDTFVVHDCMDAVLGEAQLSGSVTLCYSSVCHDHVMNLGNGLLCGGSRT